MQYTPVITGPNAVFDCSALYKVKLDDAMLDYFAENALQVKQAVGFRIPKSWNKEECRM
jgi:hypothetical protein